MTVIFAYVLQMIDINTTSANILQKMIISEANGNYERLGLLGNGFKTRICIGILLDKVTGISRGCRRVKKRESQRYLKK